LSNNRNQHSRLAIFGSVNKSLTLNYTTLDPETQTHTTKLDIKSSANVHFMRK